VAAPLEVCARRLGVPVARLRRVAATVEPYRRADGAKVWSLYLLEKALHPERFRKANSGGTPTRVRARKGGGG
jgi:hypothetical protein